MAPGSAITTANPAKDVRALIMSEPFRQQIQKAIPNAVGTDVLLRVAVTTIQKNDKLLRCTQSSLMQCVLECAQLGLLPDGILGQAYFIPYENSVKIGNEWHKVLECTLQIGYRGILELARRSNQVKYVVGEAVYHCDHFSITYAPKREITHIPDLEDEARGEIAEGKYIPEGFRGAYSLVVYKDDTIDFEYLPLHKIERVRKSAKAGSKADGPWLCHFEEMARKTAIRALGKRLPLSADDMRAVIADEYREAGVDGNVLTMPAIAQAVADVEVKQWMDALKWPPAKRQLCLSNFGSDPEGLREYVRKEAIKAGVAFADDEVTTAEQAAQPERTVELTLAEDTQPGDSEHLPQPAEAAEVVQKLADLWRPEDESQAVPATKRGRGRKADW